MRDPYRQTIGELTGEGLRRARGKPARLPCWPEPPVKQSGLTALEVLWVGLGALALIAFIIGLQVLVFGAYQGGLTILGLAYRGG